MDIIEQLIPVRTRKDGLRTTEELALSHLNSKDYKGALELYNRIVSIQNDFNRRIDNFLSQNRTHLSTIITNAGLVPDNQNLSLLLRYYLYRFSDILNLPESFEFRLERFEPILFGETTLSNPYEGIRQVLINDVLANRVARIREIQEFHEDVDRMNGTVQKFQDALDPIISNAVVGLKGKCDVEKNLRLFNRLRSVFD